MGVDDPKEFAPLAGEAKRSKLDEIREKYKGNGTIEQRSRLLEAIHQCSISTIEARKFLDILHPAGRVMELRKSGWLIDTLPGTEYSDIGKSHRVTVYLLRGRADA